jgi:uracil-DNA glycosylase
MSLETTFEASWDAKLANEFSKPYFLTLSKTVQESYKKGPVFPASELVFNAFKLCPFDQVKVVILGQDPYHGPGQALGLSFSVPENFPIPPSLRNIYKEINTDIGSPIPTTGNLEHWATQGILLLNATLTVLPNTPGSHQGLGWETFTDAVIKKISDEKEHVVFLLWGKYAQAKAELIDHTKHLVLTAPHPSPFSAHKGFLGCKHFSKTNSYLKANYLNEIKW